MALWAYWGCLTRGVEKASWSFVQMTSQVRVQHKLPVTYIALDWHQLDKELGSDKLVEAFWTQLSAVIPQQVQGIMGPRWTLSAGLGSIQL